MLLAFQASLCTIIQRDGCTRCEGVRGGLMLFTEHKIMCLCADESQMIQIGPSGNLECGVVSAGYYVTNDTFDVKPTNCGTLFYDYVAGVCDECNNSYSMRTSNRLCVRKPGVTVVNQLPTCYLGFGASRTVALECEQCVQGNYSVDINGYRRCARCQLNEFRYGDKCLEYTTANCAILNKEMTARPLRCLCPDGSLPVFDMATAHFLCGQPCENAVYYIGHGIPARICRQSDRTILNTTCKSTGIDSITGLCQCGTSATAQLLDDEGNPSSVSTCVLPLLESWHVQHCNVHGLFYRQFKVGSQLSEGLFCAQMRIPWSICEVYQSANCTPCHEIAGATSFQTENKLVCYCEDEMQLIYEKDFTLQCADVPAESRVNQSTYTLVPAQLWQCDWYWDPKSQRCRKCNLPSNMMRKIEQTKTCIVDDGYVSLGRDTCLLGFASVYLDTGELLRCDKCPLGTQTVIQQNESQTCSTCGEHQYREAGWCNDFSKRNCQTVNESLSVNRAKTQCIWNRRKLPVYSLKTKMYLTQECQESDFSYFNGYGIPAIICRQHGKTIQNTTCPEEYPLNETTGLCSCPEGQATVVYFLPTGNAAEFSLCRPIYLSSTHIVNCNQNSIFVFQYATTPIAYCMQRGGLNVFKTAYYLSDTEIAGIAVGCVAAVAALCVSAWWLVWRRRRRCSVSNASNASDGGEASDGGVQLVI